MVIGDAEFTAQMFNGALYFGIDLSLSAYIEAKRSSRAVGWWNSFKMRINWMTRKKRKSRHGKKACKKKGKMTSWGRWLCL
jgi:hypothetical protein